MILLPTGLLRGARRYYKDGHLRIHAGLLVALGVFVGAYFGARISGAVSATTVKRCYAVFLLLIAAYFLLSPQLERKPAERAEGRASASDLPAGP